MRLHAAEGSANALELGHHVKGSSETLAEPSAFAGAGAAVDSNRDSAETPPGD